MIRTQIQLRSEQIQWLKNFAVERGISMSHVIRESIDSYRTYTERVRGLNSKKKKALKAVGAFSTELKVKEG